VVRRSKVTAVAKGRPQKKKSKKMIVSSFERTLTRRYLELECFDLHGELAMLQVVGAQIRAKGESFSFTDEGKHNITIYSQQEDRDPVDSAAFVIFLNVRHEAEWG
jgi:DUF971 family protein